MRKRYTFALNEDLVEKTRVQAKIDRRSLSGAIERGMDLYLSNVELVNKIKE